MQQLYTLLGIYVERLEVVTAKLAEAEARIKDELNRQIIASSPDCTKVLDLQGHVLLRLNNAAGLGWWVWLERDSAPADWQALRVALVAWREAQRRPARLGA